MPIYDFKCQSCGKVFEQIVSMETKYFCCDCGEQARRIPSLTANMSLKWSPNYIKIRPYMNRKGIDGNIEIAENIKRMNQG